MGGPAGRGARVTSLLLDLLMEKDKDIKILPAPHSLTLEEAIGFFVLERLRYYNGNKSKTARSLCIALATMYRYIKKYNWDV